MASVLRDKRPALMLEALSVLGDTFVATESANGRSLPAAELGDLARPFFQRVEIEPNPQAARRLALGAAAGGAVLVTGSLYLLSELHGHG